MERPERKVVIREDGDQGSRMYSYSPVYTLTSFITIIYCLESSFGIFHSVWFNISREPSGIFPAPCQLAVQTQIPTYFREHCDGDPWVLMETQWVLMETQWVSLLRCSNIPKQVGDD